MQEKRELLYARFFFAIVAVTLAIFIAVLQYGVGDNIGFAIGVICAVVFCAIVGAAAITLVCRKLSASFRGVESEAAAVIGKVVTLLEVAAIDLEKGDE